MRISPFYREEHAEVLQKYRSEAFFSKGCMLAMKWLGYCTSGLVNTRFTHVGSKQKVRPYYYEDTVLDMLYWKVSTKRLKTLLKIHVLI